MTATTGGVNGHGIGVELLFEELVGGPLTGVRTGWGKVSIEAEGDGELMVGVWRLERY